MATIFDQSPKMTATKDVDTETPENPDGPAVVGRAQVDERLAAKRRLDARTAAAKRAANASKTGTTMTTTEAEKVVPAGPHPRASLLATLSLILGTGAGLAALTGVLAGPSVALGLVAAFVGIGGLSATSKRHVAGKGAAVLGILFGLGAVVVGTLAMSGVLPWLNGDSDQVMRIREWLEARLPWMFPSE